MLRPERLSRYHHCMTAHCKAVIQESSGLGERCAGDSSDSKHTTKSKKKERIHFQGYMLKTPSLMPLARKDSDSGYMEVHKTEYFESDIKRKLILRRLGKLRKR